MSNATPARSGQVNSSGSATALFLKVFGGEVLAAFKNKTVAMDRHMVRTIDHGITAQFPAYGGVTSAVHTAGAEIVGQTQNYNERTISIDGLVYSDIFIPVIDEYMQHYDLRGPAAQEVGYALANGADARVLQTLGLTARASATVTGGNGGTAITSASAGTSSTALITALFTAAQRFDEKNVPVEGRQVFVRPAQYYLLANDSTLISRDYSSQNGDRQTGQLGFGVAGIEVVSSNNVPITNISTGIAAYQGDFSTSVAFASVPNAVGTVKLMDLTAEAQYDIRRQGTLVLAKFAMGHGILRPESAIEIKTS